MTILLMEQNTNEEIATGHKLEMPGFACMAMSRKDEEYYHYTDLPVPKKMKRGKPAIRRKDSVNKD